MDYRAHVFLVMKGKDGIWTRAWRKSTCRISSPVPYQAGPPFQDAEKGIWTLTPEGAHAPEACVSAVPPPPHSSIIHFLGKLPRKKREYVKVTNMKTIDSMRLQPVTGSACRFSYQAIQPYFSIFGIIDSINLKGVRFARNNRQGLGWLLLCGVRRPHLPDTGSWKF